MKKFGVLGVFLVIMGGLVLLAVIAVMWAVGINNSIVRLEQKAESTWANVENVYQRRADLIPNLVNTVRGAANFERSTLSDVVEARASVGQVQVSPSQMPNAQQLRQFEAAQQRLSSALSRLLVVVERYPELKATASFRDLQAQLEGTENRIAVARRDFNEAVRAYNTRIQQIPANFVANLRGFEEKPYFQATAGAERPPEVEFDFNNSTSEAQ